MRDTVIQWTYREKIIAIVRGIEPEKCLKVAQALYDGGIRLMEVTYAQSNPGSWEQTAQAIHDIAKTYEGRMLVGAGTVTSVELVEMTHKAGGLFIISPDCNVDVIRRTRELGMVSMPGALTPTEVMTAHHAGADFVKLFPISDLGVGYLKAIRAPISHVKMMVVGGINEKNIGQYLAAGAVGAGIGGNLANRAWIEAGEFDKITETAKALVRALKDACS
jgi:2-dehydro-3-deoxyphosphogluconate aldolase/(4S)-4-hydroxy-2-oxoglutarate aldolase